MSESNPPPLPPVTLAYASPVIAPNSGSAWDQNGVLVTLRKCTLPNRCVKCGGEAAHQYKKKFGWHSPLWYLLILVNILVYAIVAICVRKDAVVVIGLCDRHCAARNRRLIIVWSILGIGLLLLAAGIALLADFAGRRNEETGGWLILLSVLTMLASAITSLVILPLLKPKKIDENYAWFNGADPAFLRQLPQA